jgi:Asp-tRNA(Asn)/Glu-tRNA(Gln) amidotransferase A subunit family amidase
MDQSLLRSAASIRSAVISRQVSVREVVQQSLARCHAVQGQLNAFTIILDEEALHTAETLDHGATAPGPLHGVPVAIKDMTPSRGHPTTLGSWTTGAGITAEDAEIVRRLRAAGAIIVAKTTTPEFAWSSFTKSPRFGATGNPWDPARSTGGSSGGSAVAVATGCIPLAEGTDMGGSVRIPAAFCGVMGMKPSLGRIPMTILPTALDDQSHFGALANSVEDITMFLQATAGPHPRDMRALDQVFDARRTGPVEPVNLRCAFSPDLGYFNVSPRVAATVAQSIVWLRAAGVRIDDVALDWTVAVNDAWYDWWGVFLASQFGGLAKGQEHRLDPQVLALMRRGHQMSAVDYRAIERVRTRVWLDLCALFDTYDALICPTCAILPPLNAVDDFAFDTRTANGRLNGLDMTNPFNMASPCPAMSMPCGLADGLPVGLQVVTSKNADEWLLAICSTFARALGRAPVPPI